MKFEERLMVLRKKKGWSQEDLSNQIGVSRQTISKWESAQTTPELNKLVELSKIFEISIDELVDNEKEIENKNVSTKVNLKPTYILMGIIVLMILIFFISSILYFRNKEDKTYTKSILMVTYETILNDKIKMQEIYSLNQNDECIGMHVKFIVNENEDKISLINGLNEDKNVKNIVVKENIITFSSDEYFKYTKKELLKKLEINLKDFQNVEIIEM